VGVQAEETNRAQEQTLAVLEIDAKVKEDLKIVALGTSKINHPDLRITAA